MDKNVLAQNIGGTLEPVGGYANPVDIGTASDNVSSMTSNILTFLTVVAGISFILYFVIGALKWVTAGTDSKKVDDAKSQMTNAAIGVIAVVATYGIAAAISEVVGLDILNPSTIIRTLGPGN